MNAPARSPKPGFVKVYYRSGLSGSDAILYAEICHDAELRAAGGRGLDMSHKSLTSRLPLSQSTLQRAAARLERKGYITVRRTLGEPNRYEPARPFAVIEGGGQSDHPGGVKMTTPPGQNDHPTIRSREREIERDLLPTVVSPARQAAPSLEPSPTIEPKSASKALAVPKPSPPTGPGRERADLPLFTGENPVSRPKRDRRREVTPDDLAAYAVLNALWPLVEKQVPEFAGRSKEWRQRNKAAALTIARMPPVKPDDEHNVKRATAALTFAYTDPRACEFYGTLHSLSKLLDALPRLREMARKPKEKSKPGMTGNPGIWSPEIAR